MDPSGPVRKAHVLSFKFQTDLLQRQDQDTFLELLERSAKCSLEHEGYPATSDGGWSEHTQ